MVIDTSAILAILFQEPEADRLVRAIARESLRLLSASSLMEAAIVVQHRAGDEGAKDLDLLLDSLAIEIAAVTVRQARIARQGFRQFGKGLHPAGLNFGDCFAYALAKETKQPLLFKGEDFSRTDVEIAKW